MSSNDRSSGRSEPSNPPSSDGESTQFDFSSDEAARKSMKGYIKENFSELLGDRVHLLDQPDGIERIREELQDEIEEASRDLPENLRKLIDFLRT